MSEEVLTIEEAAKFLKVEPDVVAELLNSGDLPGRPVGGEWRTTTRALTSFVDGTPMGAAICCTTADGACCTPATSEMAATGANCCSPDGGDCC